MRGSSRRRPPRPEHTPHRFPGAARQRLCRGARCGPSALILLVSVLLPAAVAAVPAAQHTICAVQGDAAVSPLVGEDVLIEGVIVTVTAPDGFFVEQPERCPGGRSSSGLFVDTSRTAGLPVEVGDQVDASGTVAELAGETRLELVTLAVAATGAPLPPPVAFDDGTPSRSDPSDLERFEGMRVTVAEGSVVGPSDRRGVALMVTYPGRTFREPGLPRSITRGAAELQPGWRENAVTWDENPEIFALDPDALVAFDLPLPAGTRLGGGDDRPLVGVMATVDHRPTLWPTEPPLTATPVLPRPVPAAREDEITVATLDLDGRWQAAEWNDGTGTRPQRSRHAVGRIARTICHVLGRPSIVALQGVENQRLLDSLVRAADAGCGITYQTALSPGRARGGPGALAFLVDESIELRGRRYEWEWDDEIDYLFDTLPLFVEVGLPGGAELQVVNVQLAERSGIDLPQREELRVRRAQQAIELARGLQAHQQEGRLLVLGDFASFQFSDGHFDVLAQVTGAFEPDATGPGSGERQLLPIVDPPLTNEALRLGGSSRCQPPGLAAECYDSIDEGNAALLSHILTSQELAPAVTHLAAGRAWADRPERRQADTDISRTPAPRRDGLVLYLDPARLDPAPTRGPARE